MPTVATISPASATEGSDGIQLYIATLLLRPLPILFVLTNGTAGGADYTTTNVDVLFLRVQLLELFRYPTADTIDEVTETLALPLELLRLRVQLSTIMPLLWQRSLLLRLLKEVLLYSLYIEQPFC
jgi:hypothetical protein